MPAPMHCPVCGRPWRDCSDRCLEDAVCATYETAAPSPPLTDAAKPRLHAVWLGYRVLPVLVREVPGDTRALNALVVAERMARKGGCVEAVDSALRDLCELEWRGLSNFATCAVRTLQLALEGHDSVAHVYAMGAVPDRRATYAFNASAACAEALRAGTFDASQPVAEWPDFGWPSDGAAAPAATPVPVAPPAEPTVAELIADLRARLHATAEAVEELQRRLPQVSPGDFNGWLEQVEALTNAGARLRTMIATANAFRAMRMEAGR